MNEYLAAVLLGILEGLTEFIPVSSTGHLVLLGNALGFTGARAEAFEIFIQLGAILAVVVLYWRRFVTLLDVRRGGVASSPSFAGWEGMRKLGIACVPVVMAGAFLHEIIGDLMEPLPVAVALIAGGLAILFFDRPRKGARVEDLAELSIRDCLLIGTFQCLALWPGVSRSGATIIGALMIGCSRMVAAEFSFLVAVPVMCAAVGFKMLTEFDVLTASDAPIFALGFVVAFLVAVFAIRFFLAIVQRTSMAAFGWYRIVLGVLVLWFL